MARFQFVFAAFLLIFASSAFADQMLFRCVNKADPLLTMMVSILNGGNGSITMRSGLKESNGYVLIASADQAGPFVTTYEIQGLNAQLGISIDLSEAESETGWMFIAPESRPGSGSYNCKINRSARAK